MEEQVSRDPKSSHHLTGRQLRQATTIFPSTGQRLRREITLRDPASFSGGLSSEQTPLITNHSWTGQVRKRPNTFYVKFQEKTVEFIKQNRSFWTSDVGHGVLKYSVAYLVATLATFAPPIASLLGTHQDGNQLVANVVVWFDPARSCGSMVEAMLLAILAYGYGVGVGFLSMATAGFFNSQDILVVGHLIILLLFVGGALGLVSWVKQHFNYSTLNVACSLASLSIVTVLTKEGAVQNVEFSFYKISQLLKMLAMGIVISVIINLCIWPISARAKLRESLTKSTDAFGDLLAKVTGSFLSGHEEDLNHPVVVAASTRFKSVFSSLPKHLAEAKWEHYLLGTESRYKIEKRLVQHVQQIAQDLGGLRIAAATQFSLLSEGRTEVSTTGLRTSYKFDDQKRNLDYNLYDTGMDIATAMLASIEEAPETQRNSTKGSAGSQASNMHTLHTPADIFETFIMHLGPPMEICLLIWLKSLAFTLREILNNLPYTTGVDHATFGSPVFRSSLADAIKLFESSRREALEQIYATKGLRGNQDLDVAADFEEVAASCGQFTASLQDFAEDCLKYIDVLNELAEDLEKHRISRTWKWTLFWRASQEDEEMILEHPKHDPTKRLIRSMSLHKSEVPELLRTSPGESPQIAQAFPYRLWPYLRFLRREDIRFAIKVGGGATIFAMFAYIPTTQPFYNRWHLEWGLAAYMLVCSMTVGASNSTGWSRCYGTLMGGGAAIIVWLVSAGNKYALAFLGWIVSVIFCFFILARGQGPLGRFSLLAYTISIVYTYALSIDDPDTRLPGESGGRMEIFRVVFHRVVAILVGCVSGVFVTRFVWPIEARKKLKYGLTLLWLRMALIWKQAPLSRLLEENAKIPSYMDLASETALREYVSTLDELRKHAVAEFKLRGPFMAESWEILLKSTTRMLDAYHALNVIMQKNLKATPGEAEILRHTKEEREELARRISHLLSVLASSLSMEYPLLDALPGIVHARDRLLAKVFRFRLSTTKKNNPSDEDYEILYAYALVTAQIAKEIDVSAKEIEKLFGKLNEDVLSLQ